METEITNPELKGLIVAEDGSCWQEWIEPVIDKKGKPVTDKKGNPQFTPWYVNTNTQESTWTKPNGAIWTRLTDETDTWYRNEETTETSWNPCIKSNGQNANSIGEGASPTTSNVPLSVNGQNANSRKQSWLSRIFENGQRPALLQNLVDYEYWNNRFKYKNENTNDELKQKIKNKKEEILQRMKKEWSDRDGSIMRSVFEGTGKFYLSYVFQTLDLDLAKLGVDMLHDVEMHESKRLIYWFTHVINDVFERLESHVTKIVVELHNHFPSNKRKFWEDVNAFVGEINIHIQKKKGVDKLREVDAAPKPVTNFRIPELPRNDSGSSSGSGAKSLAIEASWWIGGARKKQRSTKKRHARNRRSRKVT